MILHLEIIHDDADVTVEVTFNPGWFKRGNRWGHPDNWTEDEWEAAEIESVILEDEDGKKEDITCKLSDSQRDKIQHACDKWEDEPYVADYDPCDFYDDD